MGSEQMVNIMRSRIDCVWNAMGVFEEEDAHFFDEEREKLCSRPLNEQVEFVCVINR